MKYMMLIAGAESEGGVDEERSTAAYQRVVEWWNGHEEAGRSAHDRSAHDRSAQDRSAIFTSSVRVTVGM